MTGPSGARGVRIEEANRLEETESVGKVPVTVMVVDDHPIWRNAVGRDLVAAGFLVVAEAEGVETAVRRAAVVRPDVVLMDMSMPDGTGTEATRAVLEVSPKSRVLVLSASSERDDILGAVKAGASGYLVKSASARELVDAVTATARGQAVFTPGLAGLVLGEYRRMSTSTASRRMQTQTAGRRSPIPTAGRRSPALAAGRPPTLTDRETEVLRLVAKGMSAKQIASRLTLSHRTVENHVQATLRKLQLANRVELTRYVIEQGLE